MKSAPLHVRSATGEDARCIWRWANDPVVRAASFRPGEISWDEHLAWFQARLRSDRSRIYIVEAADGEKIGQVRFEIEADGSARIGMSIASEWRGRGLGAEAIRRSAAAFRAERDVTIVAHVRVENAASQRTFENAGFSEVGREQVDGCDAVRMELAADLAVLFRPAAGAGVGLGHLQRCLALADAFRELTISSLFLVQGAAADRVRARGFEVVDPDGMSSIADEGDLVRAAAVARRSRVIVLDSYQVDAEFVTRVLQAGALVVIIDDLAREAFAADVVINGAVNARELGYRSSTGRTRFLLGPEYALLHPAFWTQGGLREIGEVRRVLVTVGGSDFQQVMPRLLHVIDDIPDSFEIVAIVGPFFDERGALDAELRQCRHPARVIEAPDTLADVMREADLAVSGAGQTLFEAAAVGTPTVAVQLADNQSANVQGMVAAGVVRFAGASNDPAFDANVSQAIRDLIRDPRARQRMSVAGRQLVDGQGALRAADAIAALSREGAGPRS